MFLVCLIKLCILFVAEAVNINAGLGFNGYDKKGKAKYDLLKNADIPGAEVTSLFVIYMPKFI